MKGSNIISPPNLLHICDQDIHYLESQNDPVYSNKSSSNKKNCICKSNAILVFSEQVLNHDTPEYSQLQSFPAANSSTPSQNNTITP